MGHLDVSLLAINNNNPVRVYDPVGGLARVVMLMIVICTIAIGRWSLPEPMSCSGNFAAQSLDDVSILFHCVFEVIFPTCEWPSELK